MSDLLEPMVQQLSHVKVTKDAHPASLPKPGPQAGHEQASTAGTGGWMMDDTARDALDLVRMTHELLNLMPPDGYNVWV